MKGLAQILHDIDIKELFGNKDISINGISDDSREVKENFLFIAVDGLTVDGHDFISQAIDSGAAAVMGEKKPKKVWLNKITYIQVDDSREALGKVASAWFDYPSKKIKVIGVTGTKGKSTTAYILHHLFEQAGKKVGSITSISAKIGKREYDTGLHVTNPISIELHGFLNEMINENCEYAVLEVTSHGLDQKRTAGIEFNTAILTNIKHEHLDYHKTFEAYKAAKAKLFEDISVAVLNKDEIESFEYIYQKLPKNTKVITYSNKVDSDFRVEGISTDQKMKFTITERNEEHILKTNFIGNFNALNFAAAIAVARNEGLDWDNIKKAVNNVNVPPGRLDKIENNKGINLYIDFAHTPDSLEKVLNFLKERHPDGRLISVFGCASERDVLKRPMMGDISTRIADISIFTAEDPRNEDINKIIDEMIAGVTKNNIVEGDTSKPEQNNTHLYYKIPERGEAISFAINKIAQKQDTVVICGKGHEKSMAYNGIEYPWSDYKAVDLALKGKTLHINYEK